MTYYYCYITLQPSVMSVIVSGKLDKRDTRNYMPIIKSAKKRVRTAKRAAIRNNKTKRALKSALKVFAKKPATGAHNQAQSALDTAVKKGILHKNKAARVKKQLAAKAKAAGVKPTATSRSTQTTAKKAPRAKKSTPKKTTAKKPAASKK